MAFYADYQMPGQLHNDGDENDFCRCLERIDLLFQQDYLQWVGMPPMHLQPYFLSADVIALTLDYPTGMPCWCSELNICLPDSSDVLNQRLNTLVEGFDLTPVERDILLTALLPRLSAHYAMLPDSGLRESISRQLLTRLFTGNRIESRLLQSALHPSSALFQFHLLTEDKPGGNRTVSSGYTMNESLWHFFCGDDSAVTWRYPFTRWALPDHAGWYPPTLGEKVHRLSLSPGHNTPPVVVLEGHEQDGREQALATILNQYGHALLCLNIAGLAALPEAQQRLAMAEILREAHLQGAGLMLENTDVSECGYIQVIEQRLPQITLPLFILASDAAVLPAFTRTAVIQLAMQNPSAEEKMARLQEAWPEHPDNDVIRALATLVQRYAFNPADVPLLMQEARHYGQIREAGALLKTDDLRQALARRSRQNFGKLAQRITPKRAFDDIVVSPVLKNQLDEILAAIRLRESVTEKHFGHKTGGKIGLSALFYGDSGTGKTLAAEVLAHFLGVDLIKVDLSTVVNKYVGETEKNLARIFDLAQADSGVLFFDEADALFGKRSETKDAHDRHANIEVSYLLQRLESYPGLVILATNNRSHLDSAFNRRFTFITRFTYPDLDQRAQMWQSVWPATLVLAEAVDFTALAARAELTGANIRNVAQLAAVLAAEDNRQVIEQHHIERAISRELSKLGRLSF